jgi:hypothetical protein
VQRNLFALLVNGYIFKSVKIRFGRYRRLEKKKHGQPYYNSLAGFSVTKKIDKNILIRKPFS